MPDTDPFTIKRNDTGKDLERTLYNDDGSVINCAGASVQFHMKAAENGALKVDKAGVVVDGPNGIVKYVWEAEDTDTDGEFNAEFEVTLASGKIVTVPNEDHIRITITEDLG
jgi:hypothetical protein